MPETSLILRLISNISCIEFPPLWSNTIKMRTLNKEMQDRHLELLHENINFVFALVSIEQFECQTKKTRKWKKKREKSLKLVKQNLKNSWILVYFVCFSSDGKEFYRLEFELCDLDRSNSLNVSEIRTCQGNQAKLVHDRLPFTNAKFPTRIDLRRIFRRKQRQRGGMSYRRVGIWVYLVAGVKYHGELLILNN